MERLSQNRRIDRTFEGRNVLAKKFSKESMWKCQGGDTDIEQTNNAINVTKSFGLKDKTSSLEGIFETNHALRK